MYLSCDDIFIQVLQISFFFHYWVVKEFWKLVKNFFKMLQSYFKIRHHTFWDIVYK